MTVIACSELPENALKNLLTPYQLEIKMVSNHTDIPGSFWGENEAGLIGNILYLQDATPLHSALHEACHYICMDNARREVLDTNAGGGYDEENAVCYLQLILSDHLAGYSKKQQFTDMDEWGYTFRLGSAERWFNVDADDAKQWLIEKELISSNEEPKWRLRAD